MTTQTLSRLGARLCWLLSVALLAVVTGCADENSSSVSGTVTVNGAPLALGNIRFAPAGGPGFGALIEDGQYSTSRGFPGEATITVTAMEKREAATPEEIRRGGGMAAGDGFEPIPADHPKQGQKVQIEPGFNELNFEF